MGISAALSLGNIIGIELKVWDLQSGASPVWAHLINGGDRLIRGKKGHDWKILAIEASIVVLSS